MIPVKIKCTSCRHYASATKTCVKFKNHPVKIVRTDINLCGPQATFFEPNKEFLDKYRIDFYGDI